MYDPDCLTDSRVFVNGTRLPVSDVDVWLRNEGPIDATRYAEGTFVSPYNGEDYLGAFDTVGDDQSNWDVLRIDLLPDRDDATADDYETVFRGVVSGLGNSPGPEKEFNFRARGPGQLLDKIAASKAFDSPSVADVLRYVESELSERLPFDVLTPGVDPDDGDVPAFIQFLANLPTTGFATDATSGLSTPKTFQRNKHVLSDVVNWIRDKTDSRIWIEPIEDGGVALVASETASERTHEAHYLDGDLRVINNDALAELAPVNTMIVNGKAARSIVELGDFEINNPVTADSFYQATARHETLYAAQGNNEYVVGPIPPSDAESAQEVKNEAKSLLKQRLHEATDGDMQALLYPSVRPFDVVTAKPTCRGSPATNTPAIDYQAVRIHHKVRPSSTSETVLNVGLKATDDDISVSGQWKVA